MIANVDCGCWGSVRSPAMAARGFGAGMMCKAERAMEVDASRLGKLSK